MAERYTIYVCDEGHVQTEPYWFYSRPKCRHGLGLGGFVDTREVEVLPASLIEEAVEWCRENADGIEEADRDDDPLSEDAKGEMRAYRAAATRLANLLGSEGEWG